MKITVPSLADQILEGSQRRALKRERSGHEVRPGKPIRNHPKRHGVNRRRSQQRRARQAEGRKRTEAWIARRRLISATVAAYYAGEVPDLHKIAHLL